MVRIHLSKTLREMHGSCKDGFATNPCGSMRERVALPESFPRAKLDRSQVAGVAQSDDRWLFVERWQVVDCFLLTVDCLHAHVAQWIEHLPPEQGVAGSNPAVGTYTICSG